MRTSDVTIAPMALQSLRKAQRWTQDELSRASGLSLRTIQRAEKTGVVSLSTLKSLAAVFEVNVAELENTGELPEPRRTQWYALSVGAVAIIILALAYFFTDISGVWESRGDRESVAVLPFAVASSDPRTSEFADTLTRELTLQLSRSQGAEIVPERDSRKVASADSSISEIGRALSASLVVEGAVYGSGDRFQVTVQVVDVRSSSHLWSETYSRNADDVVAILGDIKESVEAVYRN